MADKDFKVKNKLFVNGLSQASGVILSTNNNLDSHTNLPTQYGGTGTTTSPNAGEILYSASGSTYAPANPSIIPGIYGRGNVASRPASPAVGDLYFNTELNYFESYTTNGWFPIAAPPLAPTGVTATNTPSNRAYNDGRMTVAFSPNTNGGAPTSFIVTPSPSTSPATFTGSSSPVTVTGLASSTQYTYTVQSTSPYGTSAASAASAGVTATTVPQAPTLSAVAGDTEATITITPGATGGSAITQYSITSDPATTTQTTSDVSYVFTGLTNDTAYTFSATATNANGTSAASTASNSVTPVAGDQGYLVSLQSYTFSTDQSSLSFTNIPSTYKHLQIRYTARTTVANVADGYVSLRFNNDSTNGNYYFYHFIGSDGSSGTAAGGGTNTIAYGGSCAGNNAAANTFGVGIIDILEYSSANKNKVVRVMGGTENNGSGIVRYGSSAWFNNNAISTITIGANAFANNFMAGTTIDLYGVKE